MDINVSGGPPGTPPGGSPMMSADCQFPASAGTQIANSAVMSESEVLGGDTNDFGFGSGASNSEDENMTPGAEIDKKFTIRELEEMLLEQNSNVDGAKVVKIKAEPEDKNDAAYEADMASDYTKQQVEEPPPPEEAPIIEIPKAPTDLVKTIHFEKLPNFLSSEPRPFDPNTYEDDIEDEESLDAEERAKLTTKIENTIRWRERVNDKREIVKESNARFVKWSDGSLSLHIGSEMFNIYKQPSMGDHLRTRRGAGLQGQAVFRTKLTTFKPHTSAKSVAQRKMTTLSLTDRSQQSQGIKVIAEVGPNPESASCKKNLKRENCSLRASVRKESRQIRRNRSAIGREARLAGARGDDSDEDDDDNVISTSAIKKAIYNRYKKGNLPGQGPQANICPDDAEEGSDIEDRVKKIRKSKVLKISDDEGDEGNDTEDLLMARELEQVTISDYKVQKEVADPSTN